MNPKEKDRAKVQGIINDVLSDGELNDQEVAEKVLVDIMKSSPMFELNHHYVLDKDKNVIPCNDIFEWGSWFEKDDNRRVRLTEKGDVKVSTVFLGLDHSFPMGEQKGSPVVFETMVFGGKHDDLQLRCCTWPEAVEMHKQVCALVFMPWWKRLFNFIFGVRSELNG